MNIAALLKVDDSRCGRSKYPCGIYYVILKRVGEHLAWASGENTIGCYAVYSSSFEQALDDIRNNSQFFRDTQHMMGLPIIERTIVRENDSRSQFTIPYEEGDI